MHCDLFVKAPPFVVIKDTITKDCNSCYIVIQILLQLVFLFFSKILLTIFEDNRFSSRCNGAFVIDDSMQCCHNDNCDEGGGILLYLSLIMNLYLLFPNLVRDVSRFFFILGDCNTDDHCNGNLICMQSEVMKCPAYHGQATNKDCCMFP